LPFFVNAKDCDSENTQLALKLRSAIHHGTDQEVKDAVAQGACINGPKNTHGYEGFIIPVVHVAYDRSIDRLRLILSLGADPNRTEWGYTNTPISALQVASERGRSLDFIKLLVEAGANVNLGNNKGDVYLSPLGGAIKNGHEDVFDYLVAKGARPIGNELLLVTNDSFQGPTPASIVSKLLVAGASVSTVDAHGNTPLHNARQPEVIQKLIAAGAGIEAQNRFGNTPLFGKSTWDGDTKTEEMCGTIPAFVNAGANFSHKNKKGHNVLLSILSGGLIGAYPDQLSENQECAILELLDSHVSLDVNVAEVKTGLTPLMYAANWTDLWVLGKKRAEDRKRILRKLLERGADIDAKDAEGRTVMSFIRDPEVDAILNGANK
jgi:ankyrin repeat protein